MKDFLLGGTSVLLIALLMLVAPAVALWSINTIFEQGSIDAYIPHNIWTYVASYGLMVCFGRG